MASGLFRNLLLASLPRHELRDLRPLLEPTVFSQGQPLYPANQPLTPAYFIERGMVSMVRTTAAGGTVEVGPVGCDGMVGIPVFLDAETDPLYAFAQILPCAALRIAADDLRAARDRLPGLRRVLGRYTSWSHTGMAQW